MKARVSRQIAPESSPESSAKSLSQKFFGVPCLSVISFSHPESDGKSSDVGVGGRIGILIDYHRPSTPGSCIELALDHP